MKNFIPSTLKVSNVLFVSLLCLLLSHSLHAQVDHVVISQVYAGGGNNTTSTFNKDFVELFNPTGSPVTLTGWSLQSAAPGNTTGYGNLVALSGTIQPGRYFLIHLNPSGAFGAALPAADLSSSAMNLGTVGGKLALVNNTTLVTGTGCPAPANVVDLLGWGTANCAEGTTSAANSNSTSTRRTNSCIDTDNNSADFSTANPPTPRNSSTAPGYCYPILLVITAISPASPVSGSAFNVTVEARNSVGVAQGVLAPTTIQLTTNGNAGQLLGTTTGTIAQGSSSVTIVGVVLPMAGSGVTITVTRTSGQTLLQPGTSAPFTVTGGTNTRVRFDVATRTVTENAGTVDLIVYVIDPSTTQPTSVLVALTSGNNALVGGFTSQMVTFPANTSGPQTITLTLVQDPNCTGTQTLTFGMENVSGGQGTASVDTPST
ncbi:MAG: lamin tail domain-containing protein, partial [Bacteroidota bacterium]|nr:lamin tail domain-containing protein [Bacteroidota bacterium]